MRAALISIATLLMAACSTAPSNQQAVADLAPTGKLRAAINVGNAVLAARPATPGGEPTGISVDLARELARRLGVPLQLVVFDAAGKVVDAGKTGSWDIAFVALDPKRAAEIAQSPPYVQIEGSYLVKSESPLKSNDEVDRVEREYRSRDCERLERQSATGDIRAGWERSFGEDRALPDVEQA